MTGQPVSGAFSATTGNAGSTASSAANFCTATSTRLTSSGDSWTDESAPSYMGQNDTSIRVRSSTDRAYVRTGFALPPIPRHCVLVGAELSYYNHMPMSERSIDVYRGNPVYTPFWTLNRGNQPPDPLGPAATTTTTKSTADWQRWNVTDHVRAQYRDGNNGFVLMDREAFASPGVEQRYYDRQHATCTPTLVLTWG